MPGPGYHMKQIFAVAAVLLSCLANAAAADVPDAVIEQAQADTFAGRRAAAFYSVETGGGSWELISIFSQPFGRSLALEPEAPRRWIARRQSGRGLEFSTHTRWADSNACPAMVGVLWSLGRLEIASIDVPGISTPVSSADIQPLPLPTDGPVFSIWGAGRQASGAPMTISASGIGGELDAWGRLAEHELAECWSEERPNS